MIIAHRGIHNNKDIPENSLKAFSLALEKNYAIEFDIEITRDNKLIVHHDNNVLRMTGVNRKVEDMVLGEIKELNLLNTNEKIPTLKEVLDLVNGKVFLDIEIKSTKKRKEIIDLILKELNNYHGELSLKSFDPFIVNKLKKATDRYKVGLLVMKHSENKGLNFLVATKLIYLTNYDFLAVSKKMLTDKYYKKHIKECPLYAWTFNGMIDAEECIKKYPDIKCICNDLK